MKEPTFLCFVLGATCVGKSTFLNKIKDWLGDQCHLIEVGKALRAKYPPEYFEGQGSPAKTQAEAIKLVRQGISAGEEAGVRLIIVDGQPRDLEQSDVLQSPEICHPQRHRFAIELVCPRKERIARAHGRDIDGAKLQLALERMDADVWKLHEVVLSITAFPVFRVDTREVDGANVKIMNRLMSRMVTLEWTLLPGFPSVINQFHGTGKSED